MAWTQADVDAIDTAIKALITGGAVQSYTIAGRSIQKYSLKDLKELRGEAAAEVASATSSFILADTRQG